MNRLLVRTDHEAGMRAACAWAVRLVSMIAALGAGAAALAAQTSLADAMSRYFPERAARLEVSGKAYLECSEGPAKSLVDCQSLHEWPEGYGFEEASLKLAPLLKAPTHSGTRFVIPINWNFQRKDANPSLVLFEEASSRGRHRSKTLVWAAQPSPEQIQAAYPQGRSEIWRSFTACDVGSGGVLSGCVPAAGLRTDPQFDRAIARLVPLFKLPDDPSLVGGKVYLPIEFTPPDPSPYGRR